MFEPMFLATIIVAAMVGVAMFYLGRFTMAMDYKFQNHMYVRRQNKIAKKATK